MQGKAAGRRSCSIEVRREAVWGSSASASRGSSWAFVEGVRRQAGGECCQSARASG
jgi:hypothetical protein